MTPSGFRVGDLVSYTQTGGRTRYAYVRPPTTDSGIGRFAWGLWAYSEAEAQRLNERYGADHAGGYTRNTVTLIRSHNEGSSTMTEAVELNWKGEDLLPSQRTTSWVPGTEYRLIYPRDAHQFELVVRAEGEEKSELRPYTSLAGRVVRWVHENRPWTERDYPTGSLWTASYTPSPDGGGYNFVMLAQAEAPASTDSNYVGDPGEFEPHGGTMPDPGTVVRGFVATSPARQVEGLFHRADVEAGTATIERKRKRAKRADGTFGNWEPYSTAGRTTVLIEGATVFKPGAAAKATLVRNRTAISGEGESRAVTVGTILSARERYGDDSLVYRGVVTELISEGLYGEYWINATEVARGIRSRSTAGVYNWETLSSPLRIHAIAEWSRGTRGDDNAGWVWTLSAPGVKQLDPAYDPNRKTRFTNQKIGDLVVGQRATGGNGRDTVSSWVKGEIVKWDIRNGGPIVKVTDKMESAAKVGDEIPLNGDDVYPALADPASADPEEFKKTLRAYLIGRHKRGDFCQGGLNTMLAAHGIPLYETRRRAKMVITVDYDPNTTDLYQVKEGLRRAVEGVSSLSLDERSAEEFEVESDVTAG